MVIPQPNNIDKIFSNWHSAYVGHNFVYMPQGWKNDIPVPYTFVFVNAELSAHDYVDFFKCSIQNNVNNARLFTPRTIQYASYFHPSFYHAVKNNKQGVSNDFRLYLKQISPLTINEVAFPELDFDLTRHWLQSVVFLAGITLSAALIQNRWSIGTLESKLNRLWQVGVYSELRGLEPLKELQLKEFVLNCAEHLNSEPEYVLKKLKVFYSVVLKSLIKDIPAVEKEMKEVKLTASQKNKFGFIKDLKVRFKDNLKCIILYGSATNSIHFADYDLIVVVKNLTLAMESIVGQSPKYNGLELNISLFDEDDFWTYQLTSGDNLHDHALCLYGSVNVPHKPLSYLVARNFSFGFIRFRQLMGMAAHVGNLTSDSDDKRNLINYFVKIPLNVYKGIQGCYGCVDTNEEIKEWSKATLGFDVNAQQLRAREGFSTASISTAAWATQAGQTHQNPSVFSRY